MHILNGVTINSGIFIGRARKQYPRQYNIAEKQIGRNAIGEEILRLEEALSRAEREISAFLENSTLSEKDQEIIRTHLLILRDPDIIDTITSKITDQLHCAAHAVHQTFNSIIEQFQQMENDYFAQSSSDYKDVANRLLSSLLMEDTEDFPNLAQDDVIIMQEITPSRVTSLAKHGLKAYCCEKGSYNSHSSILTRALNLIALTSLPNLMQSVEDGQTLILDGLSNQVIINPDSKTLEHYHELKKKYEIKLCNLNELQNKASVTLDGRTIKLSLNLELPQEVDAIASLDSDGIGLFRTEFLYLSRNELPSEEEQTGIYADILKKMAPSPVIFRSFDLGGDKLSHLLHFSKEENPYLGSRGIRFSLAQKELFKTQIRAILRASIHGTAKIMFPMIIDTEDFLAAKTLVEQCASELRDDGIPMAQDIPLGVMIEIPSAALCSEQLAAEAAFFSIGTNDLVQYTLAVDRNNESVSNLYVQHHPSVLELIRITVRNAKNAGIPVSVCGEMASRDEYIPLLVGLGITELSVNPNHYLQTKSIIMKCDRALLDIVSSAAHFRSIHAVETLIYKDLKPYYQNN